MFCIKQQEWNLSVKKDSSELNFYSIGVTTDNANTKDLNRAVNVPDVISPAAPIGLIATASNLYSNGRNYYPHSGNGTRLR